MRWVHAPSKRLTQRITQEYLVMIRAIPTKIKILMESKGNLGYL
jgi:hypothetical protein